MTEWTNPLRQMISDNDINQNVLSRDLKRTRQWLQGLQTQKKELNLFQSLELGKATGWKLDPRTLAPTAFKMLDEYNEYTKKGNNDGE